MALLPIATGRISSFSAAVFQTNPFAHSARSPRSVAAGSFCRHTNRHTHKLSSARCRKELTLQERTDAHTEWNSGTMTRTHSYQSRTATRSLRRAQKLASLSLSLSLALARSSPALCRCSMPTLAGWLAGWRHKLTDRPPQQQQQKQRHNNVGQRKHSPTVNSIGRPIVAAVAAYFQFRPDA